MAAIFGGGISNIIDSIFYGVFLDNAPFNAITPWFHGQVIDMFYIDLWGGYLPDWIPLWGGNMVTLLPIFNLADVAIFRSFCSIIFSKDLFGTNRPQK